MIDEKDTKRIETKLVYAIMMTPETEGNSLAALVNALVALQTLELPAMIMQHEADDCCENPYGGKIVPFVNKDDE